MLRHVSSEDSAQLRPALKIALWLLVIAVAALAIWQTKPPRALDTTAPADQFSTARAAVHLEQIAREPHSIGTAANHRVRDYLVEQLTALGAEVNVETTVGVTDAYRLVYAGTVQNIVATIKGTANSRAVMLASHYDSVPEGPGAADAGSGLAAILETIRALRARGPLKNDLLVLFTDGEEEGLIGAAAFVRDHPDLARRAGVVLNFEARGTSGPAMMFETSDRNGWVTREFARVAPYPFSSSLAYAVYKNLPNHTDMTVFKRVSGLAGLNFAFTASFENYHTRRDTPANLDPRSLQNVGANALALAQHFGDLELRDIHEPDRVYFNWFGSRLVGYPGWGVWIILGADIALLVAVLMTARRRAAITIWRTLGGAGGFFLVLLAAAGGAHLVWWLVNISTKTLLVGDTPSNSLIMLGCVAAGLAFAVAVQSWLSSKLGRFNSAVGQLVVVAVLAAVLTYLLPAGSYLLQWPLLFALAGLLAALLMQNDTLPAFFGSLPTLLIFAPLMYLLFVTLAFDWISVSVLAVLLGLMIAIASPLLPQISTPLRRSAPTLLLCAAALTGWGRQLSVFSAEHPRRNSIAYSVNADQAKAAWVSYDDELDEWTREFLTGSPARGKAPAFTIGSARDALTAAAELLPLEAPTATVVSDSIVNGRRVLRLHLSSPRAAQMLLMRMAADVRILAVSFNGRAHEIENERGATWPWSLRYNAPPAEGVEVELQLASNGPLKLWFGDRSIGLPQMPGKAYRERPADMMATYGSDVVLVGREYTF